MVYLQNGVKYLRLECGWAEKEEKKMGRRESNMHILIWEAVWSSN